MEAPACISSSHLHLEFFGIDVVMTFKVVGDKTSRLLDGESGCYHGCLRGGTLLCRSTDGVVAIAKELGFSVSADDLNQSQSKLSDEELKGAAGGNNGGLTWN